MPRIRHDAERAAGKLVSAIQKEWAGEFGKPAELSLDVMDMALEPLRAAKDLRLEAALAGRSVADTLGACWVEDHPSVLPTIRALEHARSPGAPTRPD